MNPIEILSFIFTFLYLFFISKFNKVAWIFGIIASGLMIFFFVKQHFWGSAVLNLVYVIQGIIGYFEWGSKKEPQAFVLKLKHHLFFIAMNLMICASLYYLFFYLNYKSFNVIDVFFAILSIGATYLEIKKQTSAWYYWIIANLSYTFIYFKAEFYVYSVLMLVLAIFSFWALLQWQKAKKLVVND